MSIEEQYRLFLGEYVKGRMYGLCRDALFYAEMFDKMRIMDATAHPADQMRILDIQLKAFRRDCRSYAGNTLPV